MKAPANVSAIRDREAANKALERLAKIERQAEVIRGRAAEKCAKLNGMAAESIKPLAVEKAQLEDALQWWFESVEKSLGSIRSIKLEAGTIGKRATRSLATLRGWTWGKVCMALRDGFHHSFVRTEFSVNKQAILDGAVADGSLKECGMRIRHEDKFYIDLDPADQKERLR